MADKVCLDKSCKQTVIAREDWGAMAARPGIEAQRYDVVDAGKKLEKLIKRVVIHHSGWRPADSPNFMQQKTMQQGYDDMPYHFYITGDGKVYEGRKLEFIGGHAGQSEEANRDHDLKLDPDFGSIGIAVAGCFEDACVEKHNYSEGQLTALKSLVDYLRQQFPGIKIEDVLNHNEVADMVTRKAGLHPTEKDTTLCPGEISFFAKEYRKGK